MSQSRQTKQIVNILTELILAHWGVETLWNIGVRQAHQIVHINEYGTGSVWVNVVFYKGWPLGPLKSIKASEVSIKKYKRHVQDHKVLPIFYFSVRYDHVWKLIPPCSQAIIGSHSLKMWTSTNRYKSKHGIIMCIWGSLIEMHWCHADLERSPNISMLVKETFLCHENNGCLLENSRVLLRDVAFCRVTCHHGPF